MDRAGGISHRNFVMLAGCSLIATAAVIGGALTGGGFSAAAALAAALEANPVTDAATDAAGDTSIPDLESATLGPGGPTAGPSAGPSSGAPPASDPTTTPTTTTDTTTPPPPPPPPPAAGPFGHVFVVSLTSPGYDNAFGEESEMPYLADTLRPQGVLLSGYELLHDKGLPNLIGMTSGQRPNADTEEDCSTYSEFPSKAKPDEDTGLVDGDGCIYPATMLSVADQVAATGRTWRGYIEGMANDAGPANCVRPTPNGPDETERTTNGVYAARHNPFIYYHSLIDLGSCTAGDIPGDQLLKDLKSESTTPAYSFIAPNLCHSGVERACSGDGPDGAAAADAYLSELVPKILKSAAYKKDGLLIVTFDELAASAKDEDGPVGTVAVSGQSTPGATLAGKYTPYSLLRSTEDSLGLSALASAVKADSFADDIVNGGD